MIVLETLLLIVLVALGLALAVAFVAMVAGVAYMLWLDNVKERGDMKERGKP